MTKDILYNAIQNIDDDLVNNFNLAPKKNFNKRWLVTVATCICVIISLFCIINLNVSTEVNARVNRTVIEQGEYYQIVEIKRIFQNGLRKTESTQYNYIVYNGKFVLASGISMNRPEVHYLSETVICIEHSDYSQEYMTYCDLTVNNIDDLVSNWTIKKEAFVFEHEGYLVYLDSWDDNETFDVVCINSIDDKYYNSLEIFDLNSKNSNISVSFNNNKTKIKILYTDNKGKKNTKFMKIPKKKQNKNEIVVNTSEVDCIWKDRLVDQTQYTYTYNIYFEINREVEEPFYDEEDDLYQSFVIINNKIIDEGCYFEYQPDFVMIDNNILSMKYIDNFNYFNYCKFYNINTCEISKKYIEPLFTVDGVVAELTNSGEGPSNLEFYDIFTGDNLKLPSIELIDVKITVENHIEIKYKDNNNKIISKKLVLTYPPATNSKLKEKNIDNIAKLYEITLTDKQYITYYEPYRYYIYFIYNKDMTKIVHFDFNKNYANIKKITDDIIKISSSWGEGTECAQFYNIKTDVLSKEYIDVTACTKETVVYLTYKNNYNDVYVNITDLFGTYAKKYKLDKKYTTESKYYYGDMKIENNKLIIKMTYLADGDGKDEIVEYPIK